MVNGVGKSCISLPGCKGLYDHENILWRGREREKSKMNENKGSEGEKKRLGQ